MITWFYKEMEKLGSIREREISPYNKIDKGPMHFKLHAYEIENLGTFSTIEMKALLGMMKMTTIIFTPKTKDMPLLSLDLIKAMGQQTILLELYNTNLEEVNLSSMDKIKEKYVFLPDHSLGEKWYDYLKLSPTLCKKGKGVKQNSETLIKEWVSEFIKLLKEAKDADSNLKEEKVKAYVDGLFSNGGPSTDQFKKMIGEKPAYDLFSHYLFGAISSNLK